ncbi:MAG: PTS glucitol/sorbitol transporter subunit IIA [Dermabacter sp.]|nr:PTS glucitol/sorbitol transporter subunit IIA [Dermabacter sp.]
MSAVLWSATVSHIGADAAMMMEEGVIILFGEPVPDALADVSLVHRGSGPATRDLAVGDIIAIGEAEYRVDAFGDLAVKNLAELGHIVLYVNQPELNVLPGAVLVTGPEAGAPSVGASITIRGAA